MTILFVERYRLIDDVVEKCYWELDYVPSKSMLKNDIEYKYILCQGLLL